MTDTEAGLGISQWQHWKDLTLTGLTSCSTFAKMQITVQQFCEEIYLQLKPGAGGKHDKESISRVNNEPIKSFSKSFY